MRTKKQKYIHRQVTRHGRVIWYFHKPGKHKVRLPDEFGTPEFAQAVSDAEHGIPPDPHLRQAVFDRKMTWAVGKAMTNGVRAAKTRARKRGWDFDLTVDWALDQAKSQGFKCSLTGIPFYTASAATSKVNPYVPSLDRVDCSKGYTRDNVRIVCWAVNAMLLDWGEDIFAQVASRLKAWKPKRPLAMCKPSGIDVPT